MQSDIPRTKRRVVRALKLAAIALAALFAAVQFVGPARTNPAVAQGQSIENHVRMTPEVAGLLERSCDDCHSNRTDWPWYSNVAPASWFVTDHVDHGRSHLNFSEWARLDDDEADEMLDQMCREAKSGAMPLESYTLLHRDSRLSPADVKTLCDWAHEERRRIAAAQGVSRSAR